MTARTLLSLLALVLAAAGCARVEGRTAWEEAMHTQTVPPMRPPANAVFPVLPAPFSPGIFPCSRCHEGGEPVRDTLPAIPHGLHVGRGIECADCHQDGDATADPRIPQRETCDTCHGDAAKLSKGAAAYFAAVTDKSGATVLPHRWKTRDVDPKHSRHLKAGVACVSCHGEPSDTPFAKPRPVTFMARCIACHEEKAKPVKCETCHKETTQKQHANIVLHHAEEQRGCLDCHDKDDRDHLRLANGSPVSFAESFKLCGQCHGTQFRDWKIGLHGKRTGEWNGRREYRLCVECHYPHDPRFKPMTPVALPLRPAEVR